MENEGVEPLQVLQTPVKRTLLEDALVSSTPQQRDSQPKGGSNEDHKADKTENFWPVSLSPKVKWTYGKKNKGRARDRDRTNVPTPTPSTSRLPRARSSAALKGEIPKETLNLKPAKKKRLRSPSPTAPKPAKHHRTLSAPVKRSSSTSNLREAKRRPRKPTVQRTSTEPTKKQTTVEYTLHLDSDLSDLDSSLSRSASPESDDEITKAPTPPPPSFPSQGPSKPATGSASRPIKPPPRKPRPLPSGSSSGLTSRVWVLIDPKTGRTSDDGQGRLWWPGKILSKAFTDDPLNVQLSNRKAILVSSPNRDKILSWLDSNDKQRFKEPTFQNPDGLESPRRKSKGEQQGQVNLERSWWAAVGKTGEDEDAEDSDELPDVQNMFTRTSTTSVSSARAISEDIFVPTPITTQEIWEDPGPDTSLSIPGELVFGRDRDALRGKDGATSVEHWAAKILEYIPSTKRNKPGRYKVLWMSGETGNLKRDWFYDIGQPQFFTCKLGEIDSSGGAEMEPDISGCDFSKRSPSPEPAADPPTCFEFLELSLRQQFAYVKPVLSAVLKNEYAPLMELQGDFFSGAKRNWTEHSSRSGSMTDDHVDTLSVYLKEWVLRARHGDQVVQEEASTPLFHGERQRDSNPETVTQVQEVEVTEELDENMDKIQDEPSEPSFQASEQIPEVKVTDEIDENMENLQDRPSEPSALLSTRTDAALEKEDDTEPELNDGSRSSSPPMTEAMSSPGPLPPTSSFVSIAESSDSFVLEPPARDEVDDAMSAEPLEVPEPPAAELPSVGEVALEEASDVMIVDDDDTTNLSTQLAVQLDATQLPLPHDEHLPTPRPTPPRQYGSVEYENLHPLKKITYISDVLLIEVVRQVILWRAGERNSSDLLDPEEEQRLFDLGETLLETDWVVKLTRNRLSRTGDTLDSTTPSRSGKRQLRAQKPVNYREKI